MTYANTPHASTAGPGTRASTNGLAIAGLVCGIVGFFVFAIVLGPLAIIFGGIGLSRARAGAGKRAMSMWAIALGIVDIVLFIVLLTLASKNGGMYLHF